jgi:hypothetical protein
VELRTRGFGSDCAAGMQVDSGLDVVLDHPEGETMRYDIEVVYPGEKSDGNTRLVLACASDGKTGSCDE